jgi:hypothetical protein
MLVKVSNFKGMTQIAAVTNTGNQFVDIPNTEWINEAITRYEPEYFTKIYGVSLYNYLLTYSGSDATILSLISNITEATTCYIFNNILRERKATYNGESMTNFKSDSSPAQPIEEKAIEVHNRMVQCNRNALQLFYDSLQTTWTTYECFSNKTFIEFELC